MEKYKGSGWNVKFKMEIELIVAQKAFADAIAFWADRCDIAKVLEDAFQGVCGMSIEGIADHLGCSVDELPSYFKEEIEQSGQPDLPKPIALTRAERYALMVNIAMSGKHYRRDKVPYPIRHFVQKIEKRCGELCTDEAEWEIIDRLDKVLPQRIELPIPERGSPVYRFDEVQLSLYEANVLQGEMARIALEQLENGTELSEEEDTIISEYRDFYEKVLVYLEDNPRAGISEAVNYLRDALNTSVIFKTLGAEAYYVLNGYPVPFAVHRNAF